jgi:DNA-binding response OmpR family regulator
VLRRGGRPDEPHGDAPGAGRQARVVVVNDEPDVGELLVRILRAAPESYIVERAADQISLTDRLMADPPADAVVVDMSGGGIGAGLKILDTVRGSLDPAIASLPVVLVAPTASSAMFSWQAGVDELLVRPFHARELVAAVAGAMTRSQEERPKYRRRELDAAKSRRGSVRP